MASSKKSSSSLGLLTTFWMANLRRSFLFNAFSKAARLAVRGSGVKSLPSTKANQM
jgi:hypothetical protein